MDMHAINIASAREALVESGATLSDDALEEIVCWIEGNYENSELLSAPAENPLRSQMDDMRRSFEREREESRVLLEKSLKDKDDLIHSLRSTNYELSRELERGE